MAKKRVSEASGAAVKNRRQKPGRAGGGLGAPSSVAAAPSKTVAAGRGSACAAMAGPCPEPGVRSVFSAPGLVDAGRGVSNTPSSSLSGRPSTNVVSSSPVPRKVVNTSIDYLSVTFPGHFGRDTKDYFDLIGVLLIRDDEVVEGKGGRRYLHSLCLGEDLTAFFGGNLTFGVAQNFPGLPMGSSGNEVVSVSGEPEPEVPAVRKVRTPEQFRYESNETWCFEMKGSACRRFEDRVLASLGLPSDVSANEAAYQVQSAWEGFIHWIRMHRGRCSRIDLPTDDMAGIVPFRGLKDRFYMYIDKGVRCFRSCLRSFHPDISYPCPQEGDSRIVPKGNARNDGLSFYLGSPDRIQLCIYNKKAERESKGFAVPYDSWIRYEIRYMHEHAESALDALAASFERDGNPSKFIFSCLVGVFTPLDHPVSDSNASRGIVWGPWRDFVEGAGAVRVFAHKRGASSVKKNRDWTIRDASKCLARIAACDPDKLKDILRYVVNSGVAKMDGHDLQRVNDERVIRHLEPYPDVKAMISSVAYGSPGVDILAEVDPGIVSLFDEAVQTLGTASYRDGFGLSDDDDSWMDSSPVVSPEDVPKPKKGGGE